LGAEKATLSFLVGRREPLPSHIIDALQAMGKTIFYCGSPGLGQVAKLCNNMILGISMLALSEGMQIGLNSGLDAKTLSEIINKSTARSWTSEHYNPVPGVFIDSPASHEYEGGFASTLTAKDLRLARELATATSTVSPLGEITSKIFEEMIMFPQFAKKDFSIVYQYIQSNNCSEEQH